MQSLGATSTSTRRQWNLGKVFMDLLGEVETAPGPVFRELETPEGTIRLMSAEDVLVERVFVAQAQRPPEASTLAVARKMAVAAVARGPISTGRRRTPWPPAVITTWSNPCRRW